MASVDDAIWQDILKGTDKNNDGEVGSLWRGLHTRLLCTNAWQRSYIYVLSCDGFQVDFEEFVTMMHRICETQ